MSKRWKYDCQDDTTSAGRFRLPPALAFAKVIDMNQVPATSQKSDRHGPRPQQPRIPALTLETANSSQQAVLGGLVRSGRIYNVFATIANHPKLARDWLVFARHILSESTLLPRDREILILRIGWLCRSEYEWAQHVRIGKRSGLSDADILRIQADADAEGWSDAERLLVRATDELYADACISDATWEALTRHYTLEQRMDLVFTVGQYNLVSMVLNSFGVQLDEGLTGFNPASHET